MTLPPAGSSPYRVSMVCLGNICRSPMAEGILRHLAGDLFEVHSAGSNPAGYVHPLAIEVLAELGIDISSHTSKHLDLFLEAGVEVVITVCDNANPIDNCAIVNPDCSATRPIRSSTSWARRRESP